MEKQQDKALNRFAHWYKYKSHKTLAKLDRPKLHLECCKSFVISLKDLLSVKLKKSL